MEDIIVVQLKDNSIVQIKNVPAERIEIMKRWAEEGEEIIVEAYYQNRYFNVNVKDIQKVLQ